MDTMHPRCAGLDVHKATVMAATRVRESDGTVTKQVREFGTMTADLFALGDWLEEQGITHVAMEATGVFWKPIWNLLSERFTLVLCNAQHVKRVPGRKTDVKDAEWLAELMEYGLLSPSFVPPRPLRELRELTRERTQLTHHKASVANRVHKTLEDANIKLGAVATDALGVSGRAMIQAIIDGEENPEVLADLARRRLRNKIPELQRALQGTLTPHHRFMLAHLYNQLLVVEAFIRELEDRIDECLSSPELNAGTQEPVGEPVADCDAPVETDAQPRELPPLPFPVAVELLRTIPGVDTTTAQRIVSEIGTDMRRFPTAHHLASWAGVCPGNHESAGKHKSGRTTKGDRWLRGALTQAAWAASRTRDTYLSTMFANVAGRRGKKRAAVAAAHSILVSAYHMLSEHETYEDLGPNHLDTLHPERLKHHYIRRLQKLGFQVTLEPLQEAA